jgi:chitinase
MKKILILIFLLTACGTGPATTAPSFVSTASPSPTAPPASATPVSVSTASPTPSEVPVHPFAVIGYLPEYRELNPDWARTATDIIYFSAEPRPDGTLDSTRLSEDRLTQLLALKEQYGTRIYISIGGWDRSSGFASVSADPAIRQTFIANTLEFALAHQLDGVDVDWEFPEDEIQFNNSIALLSEMQTALAPHGMIVSVALSAENGFPLEAYSVVDRIHIMSYDHAPRHSTYEQALLDFQAFTDAGIPPEKLALGVPFYGRGVDDFNVEASYAEIVSQFQPTRETDEAEGIYFNGIATIQLKTCFARGQHAAGIMIWELGQDTTDATSLLQAIGEALMEDCAL